MSSVGPDAPASVPTILEHITTHLDPSGVGLLPGGEELPGTDARELDDFGWSPGAVDGVATHHGLLTTAPEVDRTIDAVTRAVAAGADADLRELYAMTRQGEVISSIDDIVTRVGAGGLPARGVRRLACRLAREAHEREAVKLGIALLGIAGDTTDRELLFTLGRHDEFTLYCAVALANLESDATRDRSLMTLAQGVDGWGRIQVVERLAGTADPEIAHWLLRDGFRNEVMDEYLAYIAATTGDLAGALAADTVDDELLDAAGDLISALLMGGPAQDMDDYPDGPAAVDRYLGLVANSRQQLNRFVAVVEIARLFTIDDEYEADEDEMDEDDDPHRVGWDHAGRQSVIDRCRAVIAAPGWAEVVRDDLASTDERTFRLADSAAQSLGIDTYPVHWRRLQADPSPDNLLWVLRWQPSDQTWAEVLDAARRVLPLERITAGPDSRQPAVGHEYYFALDTLVHQLAQSPGQGWDLMTAALHVPVVRYRRTAITTISTWPRAAWPHDAVATLTAAHGRERDPKTRERLAALLTA